MQGDVGHTRLNDLGWGGKQPGCEELARRALSCHLSMDLLCLEMSDAWQSEDSWKVGQDVLKWLGFSSALCLCFAGGEICPPDTRAAGAAPGLDSLALVVL